MIRTRNKLVGLMLLFLAVLAGMVLVLVHQRTRMAQMAIDRVLAGSGLAEAHVSVDRIGLRSASFSGIRLAGDFWRVEADSLRVDYDWWQRRIRLVESGPTRIDVDVDAALEAPSETTLDVLAERVEGIRAGLPEIPFVLGATEIVIRYRHAGETLRMEGKGRLAAEPLIEGRFLLSGEPGEGEIEISRPDRNAPMTIEGRWATRGDPLGPVKRFFPGWVESLPTSFEIADPSLESARVGFRLEQERLRPVAIDLEATVKDVGLSILGRHFSLGELESDLEWKVKADPIVSLELSSLRIDSDELRASANRISARALVGRRLEIEVPAVDVESGPASGRVGLRLAAPWPTGGAIPMDASLVVDVDTLRAGGLGWDPFHIGVRTQSNEVMVDLPRLAPSGPARPVLTDVVLRAPLGDDGFDTVSGKGRVVFGTGSSEDSALVTGSDLLLSIGLSGLKTERIKADLRIGLPEGGGAWTVANGGSVEAGGELTATVELQPGGRFLADLTLAFGPTVVRTDSGVAELSGIDLTMAFPFESSEQIGRLFDGPLRDRIERPGPLTANLEVIGDRLELPGGLIAEWFDLSGRWGRTEAETGMAGPELDLLFQAATVSLGVERLTSVRLDHRQTTGGPASDGSGRLEASFDGVPLVLVLTDSIRFGPDGEVEKIYGGVAMEALRLEYSDLLSRHLPQVSGLSLDATLEGRFQAEWSPDGNWDATGGMSVQDGSIAFPPQNVHLDGLKGELVLESLRSLRTRPDLIWTFDRLAATDLELQNGRVVFGIPDPDRVVVSALSFEMFKGHFEIDPFVYSIADQSVEMDVRVKGLDAGALVDHLNFFNGRFEGLLNGSVPFRMKKGRVETQQGHLELDGSLPARFHYEADGLLTGGEQPRTVMDKLRLLPLELAEDGLKDMQVQSLTVDLFDPAWPETPVRIHLSGQAVTARAVVPYVVTANVNGTVSEALNFLLRLASL
ncbi:MAG: YdbH domain-containing protein [Opitutaceae bacterium]